MNWPSHRSAAEALAKSRLALLAVFPQGGVESGFLGRQADRQLDRGQAARRKGAGATAC